MAVSSGGTLQYYYDAFGRREAELNFAVSPPTARAFLYDGPNQAASWLGTSPISDLSTYLEGTDLDELFMVNNGANESYLRDALGSTVALTDSSPALQDQYTYDPYGNTTHTSGTSANPFQFTGRENDGDGLYYMRGRYYDPAIARFISRDPIGLGGGINMYAYAGDDPIDFSDPTGTDWGWIFGPSGGFFGFFNEGGFISRWFGFGLGPGAFVPPGVSPLRNVDGLDIYDGSQNGGGLNDPDVLVLDSLPPDHRLHIYEHLLEEAKKQYPDKADRPDELHHVFPKYLGYPRNGPTVRLNPAYHQMITNAFRKAWAYGKGHASADVAAEIKMDVYTAIPIFLP